MYSVNVANLADHLDITSEDRDVGWNHRLGQILVELKDAQGESSFGSRLIRNLAEEHGETATRFYDAIKFSKLFNGPDLDQALRLTWSHVRELIKVDDLSLRRNLLDQALMGNWTVASLKRVIQHHQGLNPAYGGQSPQPTESFGLAPDLADLKRPAKRFCKLMADLFPPHRQLSVAAADPLLSVAMTKGNAAVRALTKMTNKIDSWVEEQS